MWGASGGQTWLQRPLLTLHLATSREKFEPAPNISKPTRRLVSKAKVIVSIVSSILSFWTLSNIFDFPPLLMVFFGVFKKVLPKNIESVPSVIAHSPLQKGDRSLPPIAWLALRTCHQPQGPQGSPQMETKERGSRVARVLGPKWGGNHHIWLTHDQIDQLSDYWERIYVCWCHQTSMVPSCATNAYY